MQILKQTSRQAKAAYRQRNGQLPERELRRLENLAAADRRAEELREKDKRKKEAKRRREEKARKERDARRRNGIGDATQACGWNFTQHRQKDWFRSYLKKDQPEPAPEPKPEDDSHFRSSQVFQTNDYDVGGDKLGRAAETDGTVAKEDVRIPDAIVDAGHGDGSEMEGHTRARDDTGTVDGAQCEDDDCHCAPLYPASCNPTTCTDGLENTKNPKKASDVPDNADNALGEILNFSFGSPDNAREDDSTDGASPGPRKQASILDVDNLATPAHGPDPWSMDDVDEESLLAAVHGQTPTSKVALAAPTAPSAEEDYDKGLPSIDAELLADLISDSQIARDIATPKKHQPCYAFSDDFLSSELDISAEDLAAIEKPLQRTQRSSPEACIADEHGEMHRMDCLGSSQPSPARQAQKRKAGVLGEHLARSPKQRRMSPKPTPIGSHVLPVLEPTNSHYNDQDGERDQSDSDQATGTGLSESRFVAYGLSTQLIQDAAFDDVDF